MNFRKLILPLFASAILVTACNETKVTEKNIAVTVNGKIASEDYNGTMVYLQKMDLTTNTINSVDSVLIENGIFTFNDTIAESPLVGLIAYKGSSRPLPFILENGTVELNIDSLRKVTLSGTEKNKEYQLFLDEMNKSEGMTAYHAAIYNYIKSNINNPIGEYFLMNRGKNVNAEQLKKLLNTAPEAVKNYSNYKNLNDRLSILESVAVGKAYTDLKGLTPDGKEIALSEYVNKPENKLIMIDFWASWCPPCRKEMPELVEIYKEYKDKGFEIVGVSIDHENDKWKKGISDLNVTWPQMSDLKGWESELSKVYGVSSIPQTFLLDEKGNITASGFNAKELRSQLEKLLN